MSAEKGAPVTPDAADPMPAAARIGCAFTPTVFRPAWWLPGAHAQTIAGRLARRARPDGLRRERVDTPDGDFLDLDIAPLAQPGKPLVLLLHGLEGSARRGYALETYRALAAYGVGALGLNFRSCSGEPNRLARSYHSGDTGDLRFILDVLTARYPRSPLGIIGFSLGGNVLLKWLGEEGDDAASRVRAAVAVSVPYDLAACERALAGSRMGRFYLHHFLETLVQKTEAKAALIQGRIDLERVRRSRTFREFDDAATAPLHGFAGADDYYARSSSAGFLGRIRVPTLLIHARDDPFLPASAFPWEVVRSNPCIQSLITPHGGHVGFIAGSPWAPRFWLEEEAARYLARQLLD